MSRVLGIVHHKTNLPARSLPAHTACSSTISQKDPYTGTHRLTEFVLYNGQPARRRVTLFIRESNGFRRVRQTWSDALTGRYTFNHIVPGIYWAMAEDYLGQKTIVASDPIQSEPMP